MKFLDVKTDFAFKKVFGSEGSKDILISFLNSLVLFSEGEVIEDLTIVDPYQIPLTALKSEGAILTTAKGGVFEQVKTVSLSPSTHEGLLNR